MSTINIKIENAILSFKHEGVETSLTEPMTDRTNLVIENSYPSKASGALVSQSGIVTYLFDISSYNNIMLTTISYKPNFSNAGIVYYSDKPTSENASSKYLGTEDNIVNGTTYTKRELTIPSGTKWIAVSSQGGPYSGIAKVYVTI